MSPIIHFSVVDKPTPLSIPTYLPVLYLLPKPLNLNLTSRLHPLFAVADLVECKAVRL